MSLRPRRTITYIALSALAAVALSSGTDARPLKKETCEALAKERTAIAKQDIVDALTNGPDWTKANLPVDTLPRVKRYLEIEEQLHFRCSGIKFPVIERETETASTSATPQKAEKSQEKIRPAKARKPEAKKAGKPPSKPKLGAIQAKKPKTLDLTIPKETSPATTSAIPLPQKRPDEVKPAPPVRKKVTQKKKKPSSKPLQRVRATPMATSE